MFQRSDKPKSAPDAGLNQSRMKRSHNQPVLPDDAVPCSWIVLRARAKKESLLLAGLLQRGLEAWLPEVKRFRIRAGHKEQYMSALIPGYVFVRLSTEAMPDLSFVPGSKGLLMNDNLPALLRHPEALRLHRLCSLSDAPEVTGGFVQGKHITIGSGPLKGFSGIVTCSNNKNYLVVESGINGVMLKIDMTKNVVE